MRERIVLFSVLFVLLGWYNLSLLSGSLVPVDPWGGRLLLVNHIVVTAAILFSITWRPSLLLVFVFGVIGFGIPPLVFLHSSLGLELRFLAQGVVNSVPLAFVAYWRRRQLGR
jgi:hypothetical protein